MADNKLRLLMLLTVAVSKAQDEGASCSLAKRYKAFNKYEFFYESESLNALNGAVNGPKISCKVEIAVPGTCSFIVRTVDCSLTEVMDVDADGKPVFGAAAGAEDFKTAMDRRPLKFTVEGDDDIKLFPEEDERTNILNIKRGIISALAVPALEEDRNKHMPTIYGLCKTDCVMNTGEDVTLKRDLSDCDKFRPVGDHVSPLALITGMKYPLAQLIRSNQTCNYKFNKELHHMTSGTCTETHVLSLFSHKREHGVINTSKQALTLLGVTKYNDRVFDHNVANMKPLHPDSSVDMSPIQDKESALVVLREIADLSKTNDGRKRAHLAHKLIAAIRKMEAETLTAAVPEALEISRSLTYQALLQCGTPECIGAVMLLFRTFDTSSVEIDAAVYAMGMIPRSSRVLVKEMLAMAKFKPSKPIYYALSNAVRRLFETDGVTSEIQAVADYALEQIGDCTGDQEHVFLSLRVIGNMMAALGAARPALQSSVIECIKQPAASTAIQQAAVQVYRQIPVPEEGREVLMHAALDRAASVQKRVAAYLILMKNPKPAELAQLTAALRVEENPQVKSFIISHFSNVLSSTAPETLALRQKIQEAFQGNEIEMLMESTKFSRYYRLGSLEGNMIFESPNELPREVMLEMTLNAFGFDMDLIEFGMEGKGFDPIAEALFGDDGFFPDTIMKTILYTTDKMPAQLNDFLDNILPIARNDRKKRQASQNIVNEISHNVNKLMENLKAQDAPEAMVYLKLLGAELGYLDAKDGKMIHNLLKMIPTDFLKRLLSSVDNELFLHYVFMDNEFYLPTGAGFPLRVALSGTFTPGVQGGLSFNPGMREFALTLSAGIEFVTEIGAHFPDYVHCGLEMHTNIYHESGVKAKLSVTDSQLKLNIPAPRGPTELISVTNSLVSVVGAKTKPIPAKAGYINENKCAALFPGLKFCTALKYPDARSNDAAPYFPLTGDSKFAVELHPSEEVTEYIATISYSNEDKADKVTFSMKAEGTSYEARNVVILNRERSSASAELLVDSLQLHSKVSAKLKYAEKLTLEIQSDLKLPETTSVQTLMLRYESVKMEAEFKSDVRSEIHKIIPNIKAIETSVNSLLDQRIGLNEIKVRDVLSKTAVESRTGSMALEFEKSKCVKMEELSPPIWSTPGVPVETVAPSQRSQQKERIMYCRDQVYQGDKEFSLEELRAQRYYRALSEKKLHLRKIKQDLQLQIEQRLVQQRTSGTAAPPQVAHEEASSSSQMSTSSCESVVKSAPFVTHSGQEERHVVQRKSPGSREEDVNHSESDAQQRKTTTVKSFGASDENRLRNKQSSSANRVSLKLPTSSLKAPKTKAELSADKDASISRSEEAIVNGHWNKTLCRSPDDTCEFARAAQLASTPFGGVERPKASEPGLTENLSRNAPEAADAPSSDTSPEEKHLGPLPEISQECGGTSFATFSQDPMTHFNDTEISRSVETVLENVTESEDVCSPAVRSRLFQQADVASFSNFHRKTGLLPDTSGDLNLDGETLFYRARLGTLKDFTLSPSSTAAVLLKLDSSSVPWDFFISSQLRARLSHDQQDHLVQISCYVYENGCMTLWRIPRGDTIEDLLAEPIAGQDVSLLALQLLELVRRFHSCQVVHGGLKPESLYFYLSGIAALDFSNAVDLQLQSDVKTAQDLPYALDYIQQGLLSPSASPYQVDLIGLAEIVHMLLFNRPMKVTLENSAWSLDECSGSHHSAPMNSLWKDFFQMILNPEQRSSELVLSDLIRKVRNSL